MSLLFIFLHSMAQAWLAYIYVRHHRKAVSPNNTPRYLTNYPVVTVQLPLYNEQYVAERLIDAVAQLDYPKERLEIQVLDDSTDITTGIVTNAIKKWAAKGIDLKHVHRTNRAGYKAGALKAGLATARGTFIAVFDADFLPGSNFLLDTMQGFDSAEVGMVQTRWEHLNRNYSLLTRLQAFALDAHFSVEQTGRYISGCYINFNGTAGIWRKQCIIDAGNWQDDTLTEDLDLSYRAQMKGWKFKYLEHVTTPAELPPVISAVKSQQYRWNKGGAETAKKHLGTLLLAKTSFIIKWQAVFHLLNSAVFIAVFLSAVCSVPLLHIKTIFPAIRDMYGWLSIFLLSFLVISWIYFIVSKKQSDKHNNAFRHYLKHFPVFLSVSMGLSLHNAMAVLEGYIGKKTPFVRTPKFNSLGTGRRLNYNTYLKPAIPLLAYIEGALAVYFCYGIWYAFYMGDYSMLPFHLMLAFGFGIVSFYSFLPVLQKKIHD